MDLIGMTIAEDRRKVKMTVLYREGGVWQDIEVSRLINGLMAEINQHPQHPEYLVIYGHYTKEETLKVLMGDAAYTATEIIGISDPRLPFMPRFM